MKGKRITTREVVRREGTCCEGNEEKGHEGWEATAKRRTVIKEVSGVKGRESLLWHRVLGRGQQ